MQLLGLPPLPRRPGNFTTDRQLRFGLMVDNLASLPLLHPAFRIFLGYVSLQLSQQSSDMTGWRAECDLCGSSLV